MYSTRGVDESLDVTSVSQSPVNLPELLCVVLCSCFVVSSPVHSTTLAQRPASVLNTDKDAHSSVSGDAGTVAFTVLRLTSVHCKKNTLQQLSDAEK